MKKVLAVTILVAGFSIASQAQEKGSPDKESKQKERKEWRSKAKDDLNLTADQKMQMQNLNKDFRKQAEAVKQNKSLSEQQKNEQLKNIHAQRREKQKSILTPEQQQKWAANHKNHNKKRNKEGRSK